MRTGVEILDPDTIDASALIAMTPLLTMIYPQNAFYHLYVVYPPHYKHFRDIDGRDQDDRGTGCLGSASVNLPSALTHASGGKVREWRKHTRASSAGDSGMASG